jgi:hypothetical protein
VRHVQRIDGDGSDDGVVVNLGFQQVDAKEIPRL